MVTRLSIDAVQDVNEYIMPHRCIHKHIGTHTHTLILREREREREREYTRLEQ